MANGAEDDSWIATGVVYGTHLTDNDLIGKVSRMHTGFKSISIDHTDMKDSWYEWSVGGTCNFDKDTTAISK